eukprot:4343116-Prymnesium_polylepis.2
MCAPQVRSAVRYYVHLRRTHRPPPTGCRVRSATLSAHDAVLPILRVVNTIRRWAAVLVCQATKVLFAEAQGLVANPLIVLCT